MNESYKDIDINNMKQTINNLKQALNNSSSDDVINNLTDHSVLQSDNNSYFVKSVEEIEEKKRKLKQALSIYEEMVRLIEHHNNYEDKVLKLKEEKNTLINNSNTLDEIERIKIQNEINRINDEIELYNKKMLEIRFRVDELSNEM